MTKKIKLLLAIFLIISMLSSCVFVRMHKLSKSLETHSLVSEDFLQKIKFRQDGRNIYIQAKVNGDSINREYIVDTGSPCLFFTEAKDSINLTPKRLYRFGKNNRADYGFTNAQIGSIKFENLSYIMLKPYSEFKQLGMLGVNVMQNSIWSFNFTDSTITISDKIDNFKNIDNTYKIDFKPRKSQETPYIQAIINKKDTVSLMIDSGDPTFIKGYDWDKNKFEVSPNKVKILKFNWNLYGSNLKKDSIATKKYFMLNTLSIDNYEMKNIIVEGGVYQIGLGFLKNFETTIDWIHHHFYFKENKTTDFPNSIFTYGFKIVNHNGKLKVGGLYNESIISKLGVKLGNEIISINGINAENLDKKMLEEINNKLPADDEFVFEIKGIENKITLKKESLF